MVKKGNGGGGGGGGVIISTQHMLCRKYVVFGSYIVFRKLTLLFKSNFTRHPRYDIKIRSRSKIEFEIRRLLLWSSTQGHAHKYISDVSIQFDKLHNARESISLNLTSLFIIMTVSKLE